MLKYLAPQKLSVGLKMVRNAPSRPNSEFQSQIQNIKTQFQHPMENFKRIPSSSHSLGGGIVETTITNVPSPLSIQNLLFPQIITPW